MEQHRTEIDEVTATLDDVDRALDRLSDGTYRSCATCETPLSDARLAAAPTQRHCPEHAGAA